MTASARSAAPCPSRPEPLGSSFPGRQDAALPCPYSACPWWVYCLYSIDHGTYSSSGRADGRHGHFGGLPVFEKIDLGIARGDKVCLVGRNGSGKSTLMKLLAGQILPDDGERFSSRARGSRIWRRSRHLMAMRRSMTSSRKACPCRPDALHRVDAVLDRLEPCRRPRAFDPIRRRRRREQPRDLGRALVSRARTCCCWTSRPTISTCRPSNGWKASFASAPAAGC